MVKLSVIGVGNPWRRDDGIGIEIINRLQLEQNLPVTLLDGGTDSLALLDQISCYEQVLIIDAVAMGAPAGTVRFFSSADGPRYITRDALSTHGFGLAALLQLVALLQIKSNIQIIGIQPKEHGFGKGLSREVACQIPRIITWIKDYYVRGQERC